MNAPAVQFVFVNETIRYYRVASYSCGSQGCCMTNNCLEKLMKMCVCMLVCTYNDIMVCVCVCVCVRC